MRALASKVSNKAKTLYATVMSTLLTTMCLGTNYCDTTVQIPDDPESVLGGIIDVIIEIAQWVGIVLAAGGIFMLVLAYKDDNADGQSRAIRLVVVGIALIGLRVLLKLTGLIA